MSEDREIEFKPIAVSDVDLEFLAFRKFTIDEIVRIFGGDPIAPSAEENAA